MVDCICGFAKNVPESQKSCPNCGIDLTSLHRLKAIPRHYYEEGAHFLDAGDLDRALERLMAAISLDGGSSAAYCTVGDIYERKHLYTQALHNYQIALELDSNSEKAREAKHRVSQAQKKAQSNISRLRVYVIAIASLAIGLI